MNITRINFKQAFPILLETLKQSTFVALDFQMSGIDSGYLLDPSLTDSIQARYYKTKCKIQNYIPLQLGICPLKIQHQSKKIIYSPFNIYIYPLTLKYNDAEQFAFNSQTMKFLARNNFNFNKLFYEGVPFISQNRLKKYSIKTEFIKSQQKATKQFVLQSPDVQAFLKTRMDQIQKWLSLQIIPESTSINADPTNSQSKQINSITTYKNKQLLIDIQFVGVRAYQSLIYSIKNKHPSLALRFQYLDINNQVLSYKNFLPRKYLRITKLTPQQLVGIQEKTQFSPQQNQQVSQSLQMNQLWQVIRQNNIPLVVHNGFLDLMHLYYRFIDELPSQQSNYQKNLNQNFPLIFDTKYICNSNPVIFNKLSRDTSLGNCFKTLRAMQKQKQLSNAPNIQTQNTNNNSIKNKENQSDYQSQLNSICNYSFDGQNLHEAGFDAFMTGYTFINALKMMKWTPQKIKQQNFFNDIRYFLNKTPLGNVRVPYNFGSQNQKYEQDKNKQFFFTCLQRQQNKESPQSFLLKQIQTLKYFNNNFGPVKITWQDKNLFNFVLSFIRPQDQKRFLDKNNSQQYFISRQYIKKQQILSINQIKKIKAAVYCQKQQYCLRYQKLKD